MKLRPPSPRVASQVLHEETRAFADAAGAPFEATTRVLRRGLRGLSLEIIDSRVARVDRVELSLDDAAAALGVAPEIVAPPGAVEADLLAFAAAAGESAARGGARARAPTLSFGGASGGVVPSAVRREAWRQLALLVRPTDAALAAEQPDDEPADDADAAAAGADAGGGAPGSGGAAALALDVDRAEPRGDGRLTLRELRADFTPAAPGEQPAAPPAPDVDWRSKARTAVGESRAPEVADVDAAHAAGRAAIARAEAARARPTGLSAEAERRLETKKRRAKLLGRIEAQYSTWCAGEMPPDARLKWSIEELEEHLNELLETRGLRERAPREG